MYVLGIHVVIKGAEEAYTGKECVLTCFSHASTMDAFLIAATIPVNALNVVRSYFVHR